MQQLFESILKMSPFFKEGDCVTNVSSYNSNAFFYTLNNSQMFLVCDAIGASLILENYRNAAIVNAKTAIPEVYHDFMDFEGFAEHSWGSLEDIYDSVYEFTVDNKTYFICSI